MPTHDLRIDVTEAAGLGEHLETAVTVVVPDEVPDSPVVCFGWPGGGYSRGYFTFDMPGSSGGGQAGWHVTRGWIFVACDHLFVGDSSHPADPTRLTYENLAAANRATAQEVLRQLADGSLADGLAPVSDPFTVGIGQSMGGCLLIVQQGQHHTFDAIGVLGYSGSHTVLWMPPGTPAPEHGVPARAAAHGPHHRRGECWSSTSPADGCRSDDGLPGTTPGFHYDDVPADVVAADMRDFPTRTGSRCPPGPRPPSPPCAA